MQAKFMKITNIAAAYLNTQIPWSFGLAKLCLVVTDEKGLACRPAASRI